MAMSGTEKEMRMQTSLPYNHLIRESSSETLDHGGGSGSDPDRFSGAGVSVAPISVGSKLKPPPRYRECLKNHAANIGGNITDGCGEFMPSGEDGTLEALKCAACNCHRNFHRKEVSSPDYSRALVVNPIQLPPPLPSPSLHHHHHHHNPHGSGGRSTTPISLHAHGHANHHHWGSSINVAPVKMAFGGGGGSGATDSSSEELNFNAGGGGSAPPFSLSKKRFRTKFTQEQKDKMLEFAEKVGWRIPREDDPEVQRFCAEVGVKRQVLKVWMHNNKGSNSGKKLIQDSDDRH